MTNKEKTFNALNSSFLNTADMKINSGWLNDSIIMILDNTYSLYQAMQNTRRKASSVVWEAFMILTNECLKNEEYPRQYVCTSEQLKSWLAQYGNGYETLAEAVQHVEEEREEMNN